MINNMIIFKIGDVGLEPTTSWSRTKRATNCANLRYKKYSQVLSNRVQ